MISCSWGLPDGRWWEPSDPVHNQVVLLPDSTRPAIDYAIRNGKGCVTLFAAGNSNESVDNASYEKVIAVAACNNRGARAAYYSKAICCAFPSSNGHPSLTPAIWTTDCSGASPRLGEPR